MLTSSSVTKMLNVISFIMKLLFEDIVISTSKFLSKLFGVLSKLFLNSISLMVIGLIFHNGSQLGDAGFSDVVVLPVAFS